MSDMKIGGIDGIGGIKGATPADKTGKVAGGFDDMLNDALGKISQVQKDAETAVKELTSGGDVTSAMIAMEKADMTFQTMVEVRNRLIDAYQEIMRMNI
ncbi:MAG: flagellar hook-basal body complex protein FliE [Syntrophorhabdaceae bacterium]|nr:flagellar hook-basal body complex protein FliE [Syntrophorhabdaceae bacterium]